MGMGRELWIPSKLNVPNPVTYHKNYFNYLSDDNCFLILLKQRMGNHMTLEKD